MNAINNSAPAAQQAKKYIFGRQVV